MKVLKILLTVTLCLSLALGLCSCSSADAKTLAESVIYPKVNSLRDPCVLKADGRYYIFGTGWQGYYSESDSLSGEWHRIERLVDIPADAMADYWAPEVYEYDGAYYMFTSYKSLATQSHGCAVFISGTPDGPYSLHSDGFVTPDEWGCIDGTLYIDSSGQPWMVFVHEWTSTDDGVGTIACAKLSSDLSYFVSEPVELFRADDARWAKRGVTDGCWVYTCEDGSLIMLWSNWNKNGYCIGMAKSQSGDISGPWEQINKPLFTKKTLGSYDGGHGMIFCDYGGRLWLSLHSPNESDDGTPERVLFMPIKEENNMLILDSSR